MLSTPRVSAILQVWLSVSLVRPYSAKYIDLGSVSNISNMKQMATLVGAGTAMTVTGTPRGAGPGRRRGEGSDKMNEGLLLPCVPIILYVTRGGGGRRVLRDAKTYL